MERGPKFEPFLALNSIEPLIYLFIAMQSFPKISQSQKRVVDFYGTEIVVKRIRSPNTTSNKPLTQFSPSASQPSNQPIAWQQRTHASDNEIVA